MVYKQEIWVKLPKTIQYRYYGPRQIHGTFHRKPKEHATITQLNISQKPSGTYRYNPAKHFTETLRNILLKPCH